MSLQSLFDDMRRWNAGPMAFTETNILKDDADYDSGNAFVPLAIFFYTTDLLQIMSVMYAFNKIYKTSSCFFLRSLKLASFLRNVLLLWNSNFPYHHHRSPDIILSLVHIVTTYSYNFGFNTNLPPTPWSSSSSLSSRFSNIKFEWIPIIQMCSTSRLFHDLITLTVLVKNTNYAAVYFSLFHCYFISVVDYNIPVNIKLKAVHRFRTTTQRDTSC
jgi:hypothetical protein